MERSPEWIEIGRFEMSGDLSELRRNGVAVRIGSKALGLLGVLVEHAGRFVPKQTLLRRVWPGIAVTDASVYTTLRELRRALGDDGTEPRMIETKRGHGYRLNLTVRRSSARILSSAEIAERWRRALDVAAAPVLVGQIQRRTAGWAAWVEALIARLREEGVTEWDVARVVGTASLPRSMLEEAERRVAELPEEIHAFLRPAAILGVVFDPNRACRLGERPETELADMLDRASALGWIEPDPHRHGRMRFCDPGAMELLLASLSISEREALDGRAAALLEDRRDDVDALQRAALHGLRSNAPAARTLERCRRAADASVAAGLGEDAVVFLHAAVTAAQGSSGGERFRALVELGDVLYLTGDPTSARDAYLRAVDQARERSDPIGLAEAALGFSGSYFHMDTGLASPRRISLLEEALARGPSLPPSLRAALHARLALELAWARRPDEARRLADEATNALREDEVSDAIACRVLHDAYWSTWSPDNLDERLSLAREMRAHAAAAGEPAAAAMAAALDAAAKLERGERVEADLVFAPPEDRLDHDHAAIALLRSGREVCMALLDGRFEEAEQLAARARAIARRLGSSNADAIHAAQIGWLRFDQGRLGELEPAVANVLVAPRFEQRAGRALILACAGRSTEARAELDALVSRVDEIPRDSFWLATLTMLVELAAREGASDAADLLHARIEPYAERTVLLGIRTICRGSVELYLGLAARTSGRHELACRHLARAARANARLRAAPLLARSLLEWADCLERRGRPGDAGRARAARAEGRRIRSQLGLPRDLPPG